MEGLYLFFSSQVGLGVGLSHSRENLIGQKYVSRMSHQYFWSIFISF